MKKYVGITLFIILFSTVTLHAQTLRKGNNTLFKSADWYRTPEALVVADYVLLLQKDNGGWPKNFKYPVEPMDETFRSKGLAAKAIVRDATIDNAATYSEIIFLANMYRATADTCYKNSLNRGFDFILSLQYPNGGFRQFSRTDGYYTHITYNDNAMNNVMQLMRAISMEHELFEGLLDSCKEQQARKSFELGIECILNTQYRQADSLTLWCAQHDAETLLPAKARAYELPSLSGSESVGLVELLLQLPDPNERVQTAIHAAMAWFDAHRIQGKRLEYYTNSDGKRDLRLVDDVNAKDLWARFYELESNRPFFCDRDGIIKYDLQEIGLERKMGYGWYTDSPSKLFPKYEKWKQREKKHQIASSSDM